MTGSRRCSASLLLTRARVSFEPTSGMSARFLSRYGMPPMWSSWGCVMPTASTRSSLPSRYSKSGRIRSTPGWSGSGNKTPQSTMSSRPRYSKTVMFRPISPRPPRATMRRPSRVSAGGGVRSGCGWLTRSDRSRQLDAARGEVKRQLMPFGVGGGEQRAAHRAAGQAEQVQGGLGHHRALVPEQAVVGRDQVVVQLSGGGGVAPAERVDHLVQPVPRHMADHADEADRA